MQEQTPKLKYDEGWDKSEKDRVWQHEKRLDNDVDAKDTSTTTNREEIRWEEEEEVAQEIR